MLLQCLALVLLEFAGHAVGRMWSPPLSSWRLPYQQGASERNYTSRVHMCKKHWRDATLDHFSWASKPDLYQLHPEVELAAFDTVHVL